MNVVAIANYKPPGGATGPKSVTFYSAKFSDLDGNDKTINVTVTLEDGDTYSLFQHVQQQGGIWAQNADDGAILFVPWPCALVEFHD